MGTRLEAQGHFDRTGAEQMNFTLNALMLQPLVALLAGVLILIVPRILNFVIAIYLAMRRQPPPIRACGARQYLISCH